MENKINLAPIRNSYLLHFLVAQDNLAKLTQEERIQKRLFKRKRYADQRYAW
ncbi:hypothetical protein [Dawidia soli]|uniref:Uncharacterized protein n=1 Tax=Dawidia soli TaxID=2782352 RepID=A0AAP2DF39_9BACT|nr:hypothetical protein [Dawidia soli]MBT1688212.1 hypothetical protein [Dawidia soli]